MEEKDAVTAATEASKARFLPRRIGMPQRNSPKQHMSNLISLTSRIETKALATADVSLLGIRKIPAGGRVSRRATCNSRAGLEATAACWNLYLCLPDPTHGIWSRVHLEQAGWDWSHFSRVC